MFALQRNKDAIDAVEIEVEGHECLGMEAWITLPDMADASSLDGAGGDAADDKAG
ncbi:hypothetical protein [Chitinimonas naiadis]